MILKRQNNKKTLFFFRILLPTMITRWMRSSVRTVRTPFSTKRSLNNAEDDKCAPLVTYEPAVV